MSSAAKNQAIYDDLLNLPENMVGEILNGELVASPRPAPRHTGASSSLGDELVGPFQKGRGGPGGWWIFDEPEIHLGKNVVVPDLAGWKKENLAKIPETAYFETTPDWVCEVVSPNSARHDRITKAAIYAENKVPFFWIIDPNQKTLEVLSLKEDQWVIEKTFHGDDSVAAKPFDAISFDLSQLWVG